MPATALTANATSLIGFVRLSKSPKFVISISLNDSANSDRPFVNSSNPSLNESEYFTPNAPSIFLTLLNALATPLMVAETRACASAAAYCALMYSLVDSVASFKASPKDLL